MKLIFFCTFALLLASVTLLNWQAAGNMSASNMTVIQGYINANFSMGSESGTTLGPKTVQFSDYLNGLWEPAWNVVIVYSKSTNRNQDAVMYGYAFRDHWMWINGLLLGPVNYGTIIIWKDYNCQGWINVLAASTAGNFPTAPSSAMSSFFSSQSPNYDDIWSLTWGAATFLETLAPDFKGDHAYTVIIGQDWNNAYYGQVCASNYYARNSAPIGFHDPQGNWGSYLILKMR